MNAILKFPTQGDAKRKRTVAADLRPDPVLQTFGRDDSRALLGDAQKVNRGISILVELIDSHRDVAHMAGIETVSIELGSERKNVERILDTLEESEIKQSDARLSLEGLELLRRTEKLLAEAESNIARFSGRAPKSVVLGQVGKSSDALLWAPLLVFGAVAIGIIIVAMTSPREK